MLKSLMNTLLILLILIAPVAMVDVQADSSKSIRQQHIYRTEILNLFHKGQFWQVIEECQDILQEYPDNPYFINYLGQSQYHLGYIDDALLNFNYLLSLARKQKDNLNLGIAYHNLGKIAHEKKNYNLAISYYQEALRVNQSIQHQQGEALNHQQLAISYLKQDKAKKAIEHIEKAIEIQDDIDDLQGLGNSYHILGRIYHQTDEKHQNVLAMYRKGVHFLKKANSTHLLYAIHNNLGYFHFHRKNHSEALKAFSQALAHAKTTKHIVWIQSQQLNLAIVAIQMNNNTQARSYLNDIIRGKKKQTNPQGLSQTEREQQFNIEQTAIILLERLDENTATKFKSK